MLADGIPRGPPARTPLSSHNSQETPTEWGWGVWGSLEKVWPGQEAGLESYFPDMIIRTSRTQVFRCIQASGRLRSLQSRARPSGHSGRPSLCRCSRPHLPMGLHGTRRHHRGNSLGSARG